MRKNETLTKRPPSTKESETEERARRVRQLFAFVVLGVALIELANFIIGPFGMPKGKSAADYLFLLLILIHAGWALMIRARTAKSYLRAIYRSPETLLVVSLVLFLLGYLFASTADMSYAQRFALTRGNLQLAPDSTIQRLNVVSQYGPLILVDFLILVYFRIARREDNERALGGGDAIRVWAFPLTLLSVFLYTIALPSFMSLRGFGELAYVALVPLLLVFYRSSYRRGIFYGVSFGVLQTMLTNFWLGTFSLISLQFVTVIYLVEYFLFMFAALWVFKRFRSLGFLLFPIAWVGFDYLRSIGFLGFPWSMLGPSQYHFLSLIQMAAVTGVWGVTFVVTLVNSTLAHLAIRLYEKRDQALSNRRAVLETFAPFGASVLVIALLAGIGSATVAALSSQPPLRKVRVALIQQDTDPHKNDYTNTFDILKKLTNEALKSKPYLVVWSETAFVPNIRRWYGMDPTIYPLAKLVDAFMSYDKSIHTWLVTGNDDYTLTTDRFGNEIRKDYNAAVLFSPTGERMETYHKIHLVPFTEYFPYKKQLPWLYHLLTSYDVYLFDPGTRYVVFHTPKMTFSTPICFEDSFPGDVRRFILNGAQVIMNLSNDYWSLSKVEGKQHFVNGMFRAIENRRPLLRATASGLTAYVDPEGRLIKSVPYYKQAYLVADVAIPHEHETIYTRFGNWFPLLMLILFAGFASWIFWERWSARRTAAAPAAPVFTPRPSSKSSRKRKHRRR